MSGWGWILFWWLAFALSHTLLSASPVRGSLVGRLGEKPFLGLYSVVALATFIPLVVAYGNSKEARPLLWDLQTPVTYGLAIALSALAWVVVVAAFFQPSPTGMDPRAAVRSYGLTRITRHPLFMGLALWGLSHLLLSVSLSDVIFFGGFIVYGFLGAFHLDQRKRSSEEPLDKFYRETSVLPFAAIVAGRNRLVLSELPWLGLGVGLVVAVLLFIAHPRLFY
jgi:uncharacterized membrane protein